MADRKQFFGDMQADSDLLKLLGAARGKPISEEEMKEQRVSFAYGNALGNEKITKDSVREASRHIRLRA